MSIFNKNKQQANQEKNEEPAVSPNELAELEIHSMPKEFLEEREVKMEDSPLKRNLIWGIVITIILSSAMGLAAYFFIQSLNQKEEIGSSLKRNEQTETNTSEDLQQPRVSEGDNDLVSLNKRNETTPSPTSSLVSSPPPASDLNDDQTGDSNLSNNEDLSLKDESPSANQFANSNNTTSPEEITEAVGSVRIVFSPDQDGDLLTDKEEQIFGTDPTRPDSDSDGYLDGLELLNLFDPRKGGGQKLVQGTSTRTYLNSVFNFTLLYPANWQIEIVSKDAPRQIVFSPSGDLSETIQLSVSPNSFGYTSARTWYLNEYRSERTSDIEDIIVGRLIGVKAANGLTVHFLDADNIYSFVYQPKEDFNELSVSYPNVFKMMVNSFNLFENPLNP